MVLKALTYTVYYNIFRGVLKSVVHTPVDKNYYALAVAYSRIRGGLKQVAAQNVK